MISYDDLLEQAQHLLTLDRTRPKLINLRRAVSAAYYAVFHRLISDAVANMVGLGQAVSATKPGNPLELRLDHKLSRWFDHSQMKRVSGWIDEPNSAPPAIKSLFQAGGNDTFIPPAIRDIASDFNDLQIARHEADYDLAHTLTRIAARNYVEKARRACTLCDEMAGHPMYRLYLLLLLGVDRCAKDRA